MAKFIVPIPTEIECDGDFCGECKALHLGWCRAFSDDCNWEDVDGEIKNIRCSQCFNTQACQEVGDEVDDSPQGGCSNPKESR